MYEDLEDLIKRSPKPLEVKRGIAIKQDLAGKSRNLIGEILSVSVKFISKWRLIYDEYGVNGLVSMHQGAKPRAYLDEQKKAEVLKHIRSHEVFGPSELAACLEKDYGVRFKSKQSYYDLLHDARMSWHKSQKTNPRRNESKVQEKRTEIKKNSKKNENPSKIGKR
jgi:putative transposase